MDDLLVTDLIQIRYAKMIQGFKYILVIIIVFTKYVWCDPVKNKTGKMYNRSYGKNSEKNNTLPLKFTDLGKVFLNSKFQTWIKKFNNNYYSTFFNVKASIVEHVNRTLKENICKQFSL